MFDHIILFRNPRSAAENPTEEALEERVRLAQRQAESVRAPNGRMPAVLLIKPDAMKWHEMHSYLADVCQSMAHQTRDDQGGLVSTHWYRVDSVWIGLDDDEAWVGSDD